MTSGWWSLPQGINYTDIKDEPVDKRDNSCYHEWVDYKGFREEYKFCSRCDAKHYGNHPAFLGTKGVETKDET